MAEKAKALELNKFMKQETYKSQRGNEYLFTFPSMLEVQSEIIDASQIGNGLLSLKLQREALMKMVIEDPQTSWDYWDKKIANKDKTEVVEVEDFDGAKVKYAYKFPGMELANSLTEQATDEDGVFSTAEYYKLLMQHVITVDGEPINFEYWDHHQGYGEVVSGAEAFIGGILEDSEGMEVLGAAMAFVQKWFR